MADILGGFGGSFGGVQGLAAEVPLDSFYKGVDMRHYEDAKKLKKKAEEKAYLDEANKLVSIDNPNLHLSYVPEYQKKLKPLVDDLLIRSKNGQVDAPYLMQLKSNISNLQNEFEPASKIANNMRQLKPDGMSKSAREAIAMFNSGKDINDINKEVAKYKGTPYDLLDENGNIDLSRQIVTDQDPYGSMAKMNTSSLPFNSYEKVNADGSKKIITFERPAHTKAEKEAFLGQMNIPKEQWANIPSTEEIIDVGLKNPQTRKNIMLTNGDEVLKRKQLELDNQAKELALKNTQGITESDPRFADVLFNAQKIVENDAQKVYDAETNAMKSLGMEAIQLKSGYKMDNVAKKSDTNITVNTGSGLTKPEGKQKYSGMLLAFGQQKDNTVSKIQNATNPQEAANAFFGATGINPSVDITKNKGKNIKLYEPIPLSKEVKSKPYNMPIDAETLVERVVNGRKVQSKLSEVLTAVELENLLNRNNVISLYPKDQTMYAYDYNKNKFITADDVINDKNILANAAPYLRRYSEIDVKDLSKNLETDIGGVKRLQPNEANIVSKLRGIKFIQDKTQVEEASDWDKDEDDYTKSYQEEKNAPLQTQYKGTTNGNKTTTSTPKTIQKKKVAGF